MQMTTGIQISRTLRLAAFGATAVCTGLMTGCGGFSGSVATTAPVTVAGVAMQGKVFGGQQPVNGATIQLYAANQTGYGTGAYALLNTTVTTDSNGGFGITGDYTCPSATSPVYITATGGSAGSIGTNSGIAMMAGLGVCGSLSASTYISINELTTVASAYALAPFMSSPIQLSTSATNTTGLTNAFATVNKLVNVATGAMPGSALPTGATEPTAELNTLANILAACVNSAGGSTQCTTLFTNATPSGGTAPTDTLTAILDIAKNPGHNAAALYGVVGSTPPFQPTLATAPTDFTVALKYAPTGTFSTPSAAAVAANGDLWVTNAGNSTIAILNAATGVPTFTTGGTLNAPSSIAFEQNGNAWVPNKGNSTLSTFTPAGVGTLSPVAGLSSPTSIAVNGQNVLWITNSGSNNVEYVSLNSAGTFPTVSSSYSVAGVNAPVAVAINPH